MHLSLMSCGGSVEFDTDILGVIVLDATLDTSDANAGNPGTAYPAGLEFRGMELSPASFRDAATLSADRRTLRVDRMGVDGVHDTIRVITVAIPEPLSVGLLGGGLLLLGYGATSRRRPDSTS